MARKAINVDDLLKDLDMSLNELNEGADAASAVAAPTKSGLHDALNSSSHGEDDAYGDFLDSYGEEQVEAPVIPTIPVPSVVAPPVQYRQPLPATPVSYPQYPPPTRKPLPSRPPSASTNAPGMVQRMNSNPGVNGQMNGFGMGAGPSDNLRREFIAITPRVSSQGGAEMERRGSTSTTMTSMTSASANSPEVSDEVRLLREQLERAKIELLELAQQKASVPTSVQSMPARKEYEEFQGVNKPMAAPKSKGDASSITSGKSGKSAKSTSSGWFGMSRSKSNSMLKQMEVRNQKEGEGPSCMTTSMTLGAEVD
ncbi:hypothetical protein BCR33DRAFT_715489, partial [Rhizoclosmatium globosum]